MKIWVNGCFDVLHVGHIRMLKEAKKRGDYLKVGIDSDQRVKELKGVSRPINNQSDRREMLMSLKPVDEVVIFSTEDQMIDAMKDCDLIVVGEEYRNKRVIGEAIIPVYYFPRIGDYSTTSLINQDKIDI